MSEPRRQSVQPEDPSFEDALAHLEAIVAQLETGDLSLDESLRQFEPATGARKAAQVSENVGILRIATELRRAADQLQYGTREQAEEAAR